MAILFANNTKTTLASPIISSDTTVIVTAGSGARFPSPTGTDYFLITLSDAATGLIYEIMKCTARSTDTLTVVRAQESTTAVSWAAGSLVENRWTAGSATAMLQQGQSQSQSQNYGADTGTANAYVVALSPVLSAHTTGMPIRVKITNTSTGASTLNPGPGVKSIVHPDSSAIVGSQLYAGGIYTFVYDGTNYQVLTGTSSARQWVRDGDLVGHLTPAAYAEADGAVRLVSDGRSLLRAGIYADLFAKIGTTWGAADGTHFNLPDLRGRYLAGAASGGIPVLDPLAVGAMEDDQLQAFEVNVLMYNGGGSDDGAPLDGSRNLGSNAEQPGTTVTAVTGSLRTGDTTRPVTAAVQYMIYY